MGGIIEVIRDLLQTAQAISKPLESLGVQNDIYRAQIIVEALDKELKNKTI